MAMICQSYRTDQGMEIWQDAICTAQNMDGVVKKIKAVPCKVAVSKKKPEIELSAFFSYGERICSSGSYLTSILLIGHDNIYLKNRWGVRCEPISKIMYNKGPVDKGGENVRSMVE